MKPKQYLENHCLLKRLGQSDLVGVAIGILLLVGCIHTPTESSEPVMPNSAFQVNIDGYSCDANYEGGFNATIENRSEYTIELPGACDFQVYKRTSGWYALSLFGYRAESQTCQRTIKIAPGEMWRFQTSNSQIRCNETYLMETPYRILSNTIGIEKQPYNYKLYSNLLDIGEAPKGDVGSIKHDQVTFQVRKSSVTFQHTGSGSRWIIPVCAMRLPIWIDRSDNSELHLSATLERLTNWGTWEVITPDLSTCPADSPAIEIPSQSKKTFMLWEGANFNINTLSPGQYRWRLVFFDDVFLEIGRVRNTRLRFSEVFEVTK